MTMKAFIVVFVIRRGAYRGCRLHTPAWKRARHANLHAARKIEAAANGAAVKAIVQDARHAWRSIAAMPVMAAVVVVSLGVGIGVNTAVFSWIQAMVLEPLPAVADAGQLYLVEPRAETNSYPGVSWPEFRDIKEQTRAFPDLLAFRMVPFNVGEAGRIERTPGLLVSDNYFSALGLKPRLGRFLQPDEVERRGAEPVVVISYDYWRTRFGADASVLGRTIRVNDRLLSIVGVAPEGFQGTVTMLDFSLWVPATLAPSLLAGSRELDDRALRGYSVVGKLPPGTTATQAQAELDRTMRQLARTYPATNAKLQGEVLPFWQSPRGPQRMLGTALVGLQGIMLLLLLAVCGNTANLMLARATARQREVGVRLALGAAPWRIVSLLLAEHLVLGVLGAALGAAIAAWATVAMRNVPILGAFPIRFQTSLDATGLAFAMLLGVVSGLLFGLAPALQLARVDPQTALSSGSRTASRSAMRDALMAAQVGLALVVLMAAGLFIRSFTETRQTDPGFRREGVLLAAYDLSGRNLDGPVVRDFARRLLERLRALPNVESAAIAVSVPLDIHGLPMRAFTVEGHARGGWETGPGPHEYRDTGLLQDDGHSVAGRTGLRGSVRHRRATASRRQRGISCAAFSRARSHWGAVSGAEARRSSSSEWCATHSATRSARPRRPWSICRTAIGRRRGERFTCAPAPAPRRCSPRKSSASCESWIRRYRSTTSARWPITWKRTCSSAAFRRGCLSCSDRCC